jgi:hypothetical protein
MQPGRLARRLPREVMVRRPANAVGRVDYLVRPTKRELSKAVKRASRRGEFASVSAMVRLPRGGYAVKFVRIREPQPAWIRPTVIGGAVAVAVMGACAGLALAVASVFRAITPTMIGGAVVVLALLLLATPPGRKCCQVVVTVWH